MSIHNNNQMQFHEVLKTYIEYNIFLIIFYTVNVTVRESVLEVNGFCGKYGKREWDFNYGGQEWNSLGSAVDVSGISRKVRLA